MPSLGSQMVERAISYREMISRFYPLVRLRTEHLLDAIDTQVARGPGPGPVGAGTALDFALLVDQLAECYVRAASIFDRRHRLMKSQIILTALLEGDGEFHSGVKDRLRLAFASVEGGPTLVEHSAVQQDRRRRAPRYPLEVPRGVPRCLRVRAGHRRFHSTDRRAPAVARRRRSPRARQIAAGRHPPN